MGINSSADLGLKAGEAVSGSLYLLSSNLAFSTMRKIPGFGAGPENHCASPTNSSDEPRF